jgi:hypothetical protein
MKRLTLTLLAVGYAAVVQPFANAQFGSGIVFDPTQSAHAITQIEHEERSIANEAQQIEQGQQIFTNTVKIATTALQAYNVAKQQYELTHQMILAPRMLYARFLSPTSDLLMLQQISNAYGNSMGWLNSANTGKGAASAYQQVSVPNTKNIIPGYGTASMAGQLQIAAQGATVDIGDSVMTNNLQALGTIRAKPTSQAWRQQPKPRTRRSKPSWLNCSGSTKPCSCSCALCKTQTKSTPILPCNRSSFKSSSRMR